MPKRVPLAQNLELFQPAIISDFVADLWAVTDFKMALGGSWGRETFAWLNPEQILPLLRDVMDISLPAVEPFMRDGEDPVTPQPASNLLRGWW